MSLAKKYVSAIIIIMSFLSWNVASAEEYSVDSRRLLEFRTAPIAFLASWLSLDVSYKLTEKWGIGPSVILYNSEVSEHGNFLMPTYNGNALGANLTYYIDSYYKNSIYLNFRGLYQDYISTPHSFRDGSHVEVRGFTGHIVLGHSYRKGRLSILTGLGVQHNRFSSETINPTEAAVDIFSNTVTTSPYLEFKLGVEI